MIKIDEDYWKTYDQCILCEKSEAKLLRHFTAHHRMTLPVAYLFRSYCSMKENSWFPVIVRGSNDNPTFIDIKKRITSRKGAKLMRELSTSEQEQCMTEVHRLFELRLLSPATENRRQLLGKLFTVMTSIFETKCQKWSDRSCQVMTTAIKHLLEFEKDTTGRMHREIIDLFTEQSIDSIATNPQLRPFSRRSYLRELTTVLEFLSDTLEYDERWNAMRNVLMERLSTLVVGEDEEEAGDVDEDQLPAEESAAKNRKRPRSVFVWQIKEDSAPDGIGTGRTRKLRQRRKIERESTPTPAKQKEERDERNLFNPTDKDVAREFYAALYRRIIANHDGVNKRTFYGELEQFQPTDDKLRRFRQAVVDLPDRCAIDKMHTYLRTKAFQQYLKGEVDAPNSGRHEELAQDHENNDQSKTKKKRTRPKESVGDESGESNKKRSKKSQNVEIPTEVDDVDLDGDQADTIAVHSIKDNDNGLPRKKKKASEKLKNTDSKLREPDNVTVETDSKTKKRVSFANENNHETLLNEDRLNMKPNRLESMESSNFVDRGNDNRDSATVEQTTVQRPVLQTIDSRFNVDSQSEFEFYALLYVAIMSRHDEGCSRETFYNELAQFTTDRSELQLTRQSVIDLPDQRAWKKFRKYVRNEGFMERVKNEIV